MAEKDGLEAEVEEKVEEESPAVMVNREVAEFERHYCNYFEFYAAWRFPKMTYRKDWATQRFYALFSKANVLTMASMSKARSLAAFPKKFIEIFNQLLDDELDSNRRITKMLVTPTGLINDPDEGK